MPSEPVSSYLDNALAAASRDKWNRAPENLEPRRREELEDDIRRIEPFIREQLQAELREAIELEATAAADNGDRFLAAALRQALTQLGGSEDG